MQPVHPDETAGSVQAADWLALVSSGEGHLRAGRYAEALADFDAVLACDPQHA